MYVPSVEFANLDKIDRLVNYGRYVVLVVGGSSRLLVLRRAMGGEEGVEYGN